MQIVTWNCNGALRKKFQLLKELEADIYVIQECENPKLTKSDSYKKWASNHIWIGDNKNKGVGIFAKPNILLEHLNWSNQFEDHYVNYFLPCKINNQFVLLGVWAHRNNSPNFGYIGQFWKYLKINKDKFNNIVIAGDFNSNKIWDQWDRWWNHSDVLKTLKSMNIISAYHEYFQEEQGQETRPTFFLQRNFQKDYHIDYIFLSQQLYSSLKSLDIGKRNKWIEISDHLPLIARFKS